MGSKLHLLLFLTIVIRCNGHLGILTDIISTAHDRVHDTAKSILGGLTNGFNFNVQGGIQQQPQPNQPGPRDETIIVVVEEEPMHHHHHHHNHGQGMHHHHGHKPYGHGYNMGENYNNGYNPNDGGNPNYKPNYHGNYYPHNNYRPPNNYGNNYGYNKNPGQVDNNYNNNQGYNNHYNSNQGLPNQGNNVNTNEYQNVDKIPNYIIPTEHTTTVSTTPVPTTTTTTTTTTTETKKPDNDEPLYLPLDTTGYVYTGDKIYTGGPKRQADPKPVQKDDEEDFKIDVRFKDT